MIKMQRAALLLSLLFGVSAVVVSAEGKLPRRSFKCDDTIYMSSHPYGQNTTEFSIIHPFTSTATNISSTSEYGYDAIGFNHLDGYIYGINNYRPGGGGEPSVIRIDPANGNIIDLGTLPLLAGKEWIVGTIIKDGSYVIGDFGTSSWLRIDLTNLTVVDGGNIPLSLVTAWATNPLDNIIYGYQSYTTQLMSFNPLTREFRSFDQALSNVGVQPCSTAFHQDGKMFLYCKTTNSNIDRMFEINLLAETATEISSGEALGAGDMASCAFKAAPVPPPIPPEKITGSWQRGRQCIVISENGKTAETFRKCAPMMRCNSHVGVLTYDEEGNATIVYRNPDMTQELSLLTPRELEVSESSPHHSDTTLYRKVERCRWKFPRPRPGPKPPQPPRPKVIS